MARKKIVRIKPRNRILARCRKLERRKARVYCSVFSPSTAWSRVTTIQRSMRFIHNCEMAEDLSQLLDEKDDEPGLIQEWCINLFQRMNLLRLQIVNPKMFIIEKYRMKQERRKQRYLNGLESTLIDLSESRIRVKRLEEQYEKQRPRLQEIAAKHEAAHKTKMAILGRSVRFSKHVLGDMLTDEEADAFRECGRIKNALKLARITLEEHKAYESVYTRRIEATNKALRDAASHRTADKHIARLESAENEASQTLVAEMEEQMQMFQANEEEMNDNEELNNDVRAEIQRSMKRTQGKTEDEIETEVEEEEQDEQDDIYNDILKTLPVAAPAVVQKTIPALVSRQDVAPPLKLRQREFA